MQRNKKRVQNKQLNGPQYVIMSMFGTAEFDGYVL
jgi:hypothetical protein